MEIIALHESILSSLIKDLLTFGVMGLLFYANAQFFGNHGIVAVFLGVAVLVYVCGSATTHDKRFYDKESAIEYINKIYENN